MHFVINFRVILYCVFCAVFGVQVARSQIFVPQSPCPDIFSYANDGQRWFGLINARNPPYGDVVVLNVVMTLRAQLAPDQTGKIDLLSSNSEVQRAVASGGGMRYKVNFVLLSPLPQIKSIAYNGNLICSGYAESGPGITTITLEHTLYPTGGNRFNFIQPSKPNIQQQRPTMGEFGSNVFFYDVDGIEGNRGTITISRPGFGQGPDQNFSQGNGQNIGQGLFNEGGNNQNQRPFFNNNDLTDRQPVRPNRPPVATPPPRQRPQQRPATPSSISDDYFDAAVANLNKVTERPAMGGCGTSVTGVTQLVLGGTAAPRGEWPWLVALFLQGASELQLQCGGTLIGNQFIITAAHCLLNSFKQEIPKDQIVLKLGAYNLMEFFEKDTETRAVSSIISHEQYDVKTNLNDIALLKMARSVTYSRFIRPICLWEGSNDQSRIIGLTGTVVGWGETGTGVSLQGPRRLEVPLVSLETCKASHAHFHYFTSENSLCAGNKDGKGPCKGDSGGGLYVRQNGRWRLRGIVSSSLQGATDGTTCNLSQFIIYTDVAKYDDWIKDNML